jgi:hypothetical protein
MIQISAKLRAGQISGWFVHPVPPEVTMGTLVNLAEISRH